MSRRNISLKSRIRYDGRVRDIDRRSTIGTDLDQPPDPIHHTVGLMLRSRFLKKPFGNSPGPGKK